MLFANKKEEVLDIKLTPHGRYLLSLGKLKPVYYSFHDSNILYDGRYADLIEYTKDIEDRIQHNTPQPKTLNSRVGRERNAKRLSNPSLSFSTGISEATRLATVEQMNEQKIFLTTHPLGSSSPTTDLAPKWAIKVLNGEISGSVPYLTSSYQTLQVPQIDVDIFYKTAILDSENNRVVLPLNPDPALSSKVFEDGTYVAIDPDHLLLEVLEDNSEYNKVNFEVEVFELIEEEHKKGKSGLSGAGISRDEMRPLFFKKPVQTIVNDILLDDSDLPDQPQIRENDSMVNYYFNVFVDSEIDPADWCEAKETFYSKNIFVDLDVNCVPAGATPTRYDVYTGPDPVPACPPPQQGITSEEGACDD